MLRSAESVAPDGQWRLWLQVLASAAVIYAVLWPFVGPDLVDFLYPWMGHIRATGFSQPFSNYSPPYLYLLGVGTLFPLANLAIIKTLAIVGIALLTLAVRQLLKSLDLPGDGAVFVPLLPTVIFNGPFIGQCDAYWVACCVMAVATRRNPLQMAAWAGLGFAFKAQAAFIAPYAVAVVVRERKWSALAVPPLIYLAAIFPAWLSGWPLERLLTVYAGQFEYFDWLSAAPNLWSFPALAWKSPAPAWLLLPYAATAAALLIYWRRFPADPLKAALLSAMIVPFLLPKMHERYFMLADVLALVFSLRSGRPAMFLLVQSGSVLSLANYATHIRLLNALGSIPMAAALWRLAVTAQVSASASRPIASRMTNKSPAQSLSRRSPGWH